MRRSGPTEADFIGMYNAACRPKGYSENSSVLP